jgi:hypothetical protein
MAHSYIRIGFNFITDLIEYIYKFTGFSREKKMICILAVFVCYWQQFNRGLSRQDKGPSHLKFHLLTGTKREIQSFPPCRVKAGYDKKKSGNNKDIEEQNFFHVLKLPE